MKNICDKDWLTRDKNSSDTFRKSYTFIDLFCGCGGLTLGVKEALKLNHIQLQIQMGLDLDQDALEIYKKNFNLNKEAVLGDIKTYVSADIGNKLSKKEELLKDKFGNLDILVAGPPCQGHSDLNNHTRRHDPRNDLYMNVIRFVEILKPKFVLIENVSTIIHSKDKVIERSEKKLKEWGYEVKSFTINAYEIGIAQTRKRHIQIAILKKGLTEVNFDIRGDYRSNLKEYIYDIKQEYLERDGIFYQPSKMNAENKTRVDYLFKNEIFDLPNKLRPSCHRDKAHSYSSMYGRLRWDKPAQTITSGFGSMGQGRFLHPSEKRVITPHEAARIQGFPDFFDFTSINTRSTLHTMIGNAVPPKLAAVIVNQIIKYKLID